MLEMIADENKVKEKRINELLCNNIDSRQSVIFKAGAGAGKTYSLVEGLKYVINTYGEQLGDNNQKVICITYTNVATEEIKERLGNTSVVLVSTIHERVWNFIKEYQNELVEIHMDNLQKQIELLQEKIEQKKEFAVYRNLSKDNKRCFFETMLSYKNVYYKNYSRGASDFRNALTDILGEQSCLLKNISNFKSIVDTLFKIDNYYKCIENIKQGIEGYREIVYNVMYNNDQLHRMRISHDTLLEYGYKIIEKYDVLKRIIVDRYPYIFIDEYQDTSLYVVKIMELLDQYSKTINHKIFIGYYGDVAQSIYEDGIGYEIDSIHKELVCINKEFNRRSSAEIIDVANKIRKDELVQKSMFSDCQGGSVEFLYTNKEDIDKVVNDTAFLWNATEKKPLHCFMLTNKTVAQHSGFENLYNIFSKTAYYKRYYDQLNTELLSDDTSKLGAIPILFFRMIKFISGINNPETLLNDILPQESYQDTNIGQLKELICVLKKINGRNLIEYVESISSIYMQTEDHKFKIIINDLFGMENISIEMFTNYIMENLFPNVNDEEFEQAVESINELISLDINEYKKWYDYVSGKVEEKIIYHTWHGTKGLEFDNVLIIMEKDFGRSRDHFNTFFSQYDNSEKLTDEELKRYNAIRNLLYVSVTRARKNLRVLYTDDISEISSVINKIFGEIKPAHEK